MRFGNRRTSDNVEFREGGSRGGLGLGGGGMGGGVGMLMSFVFSRFGIGGVIVLFIIMMLLGGNPLGGGSNTAVSPQARTNGQSAAQVCGADEQRRFLCQVLASSEEQWSSLFTAAGRTYQPPRLVFYRGGA